MKSIALAITLALASTTAFARADCPQYPKNEWMKEADAKAKIGEQYNITRFKVDGNCYEIYGTTKDGKKAEVYFDAKTLAVVKSEIGK